MPETQDSSVVPHILDRIVATKRKEVEALLPHRRALETKAGVAAPARDLEAALRMEGEVAVLAEVKRRSPGAGPIRPDLVPGELARAYQAAGAAGVSVLTDREYFGGSLEDLEAVRGSIDLPVFRKEFILHPVQLLEARAAGADGTLLIVRILSDAQLASLHMEALDLGLTPLVEVHDRPELDRALEAGVRVLGINNRNLETFRTSLEVTLGLLDAVPGGVTVVAESGIRSRGEVERLGASGVHGVLVGETLLRAPDPGGALSELVGCPRRSRQGRES